MITSSMTYSSKISTPLIDPVVGPHHVAGADLVGQEAGVAGGYGQQGVLVADGLGIVGDQGHDDLLVRRGGFGDDHVLALGLDRAEEARQRACSGDDSSAT